MAREVETAPPPSANVTDEFAGLAPEDRVYRHPSGYLVKVKTLHDDRPRLEVAEGFPSRHGRESYLISGSIVGADGKTLRRPNGDLAIYDLKSSLHHHAERACDPVIEMEHARLRCVEETVNAEKNLQMATTPTSGLASITQQQARKAAEAIAVQEQ